ncbi:TOBE domain-containing protein, partial [Halorubrum sp. Atlit-26R]|uniref:TOBE domain-containing protein n=1 Tax=Halorubrum sp. Atlit-26R TaxID=2282128 RepID=UPI000F0E5A18
RIAIINDGELQQFAPPLDCYNEPVNLFVAGFVGSPSMRFVQGAVDSGRFTDPELGIDLDVSSSVDINDNSRITLGIRPEDVYLEGHGDIKNATDPISLEVDVVQPMGDKLMIYLRAPDSDLSFESEFDETDQTASKTDQLLMAADPTVDVEAGQPIETVLDRSQIHLFDSASGEA